jgi:hypothetical protein
MIIVYGKRNFIVRISTVHVQINNVKVYELLFNKKYLISFEKIVITKYYLRKNIEKGEK